MAAKLSLYSIWHAKYTYILYTQCYMTRRVDREGKHTSNAIVERIKTKHDRMKEKITRKTNIENKTHFRLPYAKLHMLAFKFYLLLLLLLVLRSWFRSWCVCTFFSNITCESNANDKILMGTEEREKKSYTCGIY